MDDSSTSPVTTQNTGETQNTQGTQQVTTPQNPPSGTFNASTPINSLADLKEKAPQVYKAMMEGIASNIINEMNDHQERLKRLMREGRRDAEGNS